MLLSPDAARASHWDISVTDKGGSNTTFKGDSIEWFPPAGPGNNSISFGAYAADSIDGPDDDQDTESSITLSVTVTLKWIASPASDPAPTYVWVVENASASAFAAGTGAVATANDGLTADPYVNTPTNPDQDSATMATPSGLPGGGRLQKLPVSGGSATFDRSLTAKGTSTYSSTDLFPGIQNATVSDAVSIHATPYYLRVTNFPDGPTGILEGPGDITWHYGWNSTDGNLADLAGETVHENVACAVQTEIPPFGWQPPASFDPPGIPAENGVLVDDNTFGAHPGDTPSQMFVKNYKKSSFILTQTWKYLDTVTSPSEQDLLTNPGPSTITESVDPDANSPSGYSYTVKKGVTLSPPLNLP